MQPPKTPIERIGLLLTIVGVAMILVGSVARFPDLGKPPNRPEFDAAVLETWQVKQQAEKPPPQTHIDSSAPPFRASAGLEQETELAPSWGPLPTKDLMARWTFSSYLDKTLDNFEDSIFRPVTWDQKLLAGGSVALLTGLFLWLAFAHTLRPLYRWVIGSQSR